jgi:hypothetical protein
MSKCCKSEEKTAPVKVAKNVPAAKDCESCGLDYCDCEICDEKITIQVPPAK